MARKIRLQTAVNQSETAASLRGQGAPYRDWSVWQARSPHLVDQFVTRKSAEKNNGMLRESAPLVMMVMFTYSAVNMNTIRELCVLGGSPLQMFLIAISNTVVETPKYSPHCSQNTFKIHLNSFYNSYL